MNVVQEKKRKVLTDNEKEDIIPREFLEQKAARQDHDSENCIENCERDSNIATGIEGRHVSTMGVV